MPRSCCSLVYELVIGERFLPPLHIPELEIIRQMNYKRVYDSLIFGERHPLFFLFHFSQQDLLLEVECLMFLLTVVA